MISIEQTATMKCETCTAKLNVEVVLTLSGGFAVKPPAGHGWQITGMNGLFLTRCPDHRKLIEGEPSPKLELIQ